MAGQQAGQSIRSIHLIGVGGVGMSGIALVAHERGLRVSGSDLRTSRYTKELSDAGITVFVGQRAENIPDGAGRPDVVVVSSAIPASNPELVRARELGIPVWHRSQMLAYLGRGLKTLAVAGTHGKTTTSSMLATTLDRLGADPSFLIGGMIDGYPTNAHSGTGEYYVIEADESDGSFVHFSPYVAVVTNIEADHLDHYGDLAHVEQAFCEFMGLVPDDGAIVICGDDERLPRLARSTGRHVITYGFGEACDVRCQVTGASGIGSAFAVTLPGGRRVSAHLDANPGRHNVLNATAVLATLDFLGFDAERSAEALSGFAGVRRRFELVGRAAGVTVVDDYGHHPTEVAATISAARSLGFSRVHVLFQPHRYTRTQALADEFASAFDEADDVTVMDVYSAGEAPIPGVSGKTIVDAILARNPRKQVCYLPHRQDVVEYLRHKAAPGDLVLTMGAGDVTTVGPLLVTALAGGVTPLSQGA